MRCHLRGDLQGHRGRAEEATQTHSLRAIIFARRTRDVRSRSCIDKGVKCVASREQARLSADDLVTLVSALQTEMLGIKTRLAVREVQVDSLQETIVNLAHENELLKRRLYGKKTERLHTSENQLALGNLLNDEKQLQKQLDEGRSSGKVGRRRKQRARSAASAQSELTGRRNLLSSDLLRVLVDIRDPKLEQTAKQIGWDELVC
jgi:Transposase C of IS166 homeodomain